MTTFQKVIKYLAVALAVSLAVSIIGGIFGTIGAAFGLLDNGVGEMKTYALSQNITALNIEIAAADVSIKCSDSFSVESNLKDLTVSEKNGTLTIQQKQKPISNYKGAVLTVCLPKDTVLKQAHIASGAGRLTVETLYADKVELNLGAGEVNIKSLTATANARIEGGAGKVTIAGGALCDLDLDMGVGQLVLRSALSGECELDLGVGESSLTILGEEKDYTLEIEKGVGSVTVNGKAVSGYHGGTGPNEIDISGGVGAVNVVFQENK